MSAEWTIEIVQSGDGSTLPLTSGTFEEFGIVGVGRHLVSQDEDVLTFRCHENFNETNWMPFGTIFWVKKDGVGWFYGKVTKQYRVCGPDEMTGFQASGPWRWLKELVFQQDWQVYSSDVLVTTKTSHLLLNMDNDGNKYTTYSQIITALQYCIDQAAAKSLPQPFQIETTGIPQVEIPIDEVRDLTCAEVVQRQLRWAPDAVTWFDYATSPPTLKIKRRTDLSTVTFPFMDGGNGQFTQSHQITPRNDLVMQHVVIKYEQTNYVDGVGQFIVTTDAYPLASPGDDFRDLLATIDLEGGSLTRARGTIVCEAIDPTSKAWWKGKNKWLEEVDDADITIVNSARELTAVDYPNEVTDGDVADWMGGGSDVTADDQITATISYKIKDGTDTLIDQTETFSVKVKATSLTSGAYESLTEYTPAEPVPTGLAEFLYSCVSVLHYEGTLTLVGEDVAGTIRPGTILNLSGGRSEWASMNALVQTVSEDIDTGTTTVQFGVPRHLGYEDIIQLLRMNRFRRRTTSTRARISGLSTPAQRVVLPSKSVKENSGKGNTNFQSLFIGGKIRIDPADISEEAHVPVDMILYIQEVDICVNGVDKRVHLLCSEPYDPPA